MILSDVRAALFAALNGWDPRFTVHEYPTDNPSPPCLIIDTPTSGVSQVTLDDARNPVFPLIVFVPPGHVESAFRLLDEILSTEGASSIELALDDVDGYSVQITEYGPIDERRATGVGYLGVQILVEVLA